MEGVFVIGFEGMVFGWELGGQEGETDLSRAIVSFLPSL